MRRTAGIVILLSASTLATVAAQHAGHQTAPPTPAAAQECAQAQIVVEGLLAQMATRLETARQSNSAAEMRAAIDGLQGSVRDLRAQLAPCAALTPADPHDGHLGHGVAPGTTTPGTKKPPA